ncbi:MAG TPA: purine nucleoside permease [Acidobacteriaceae bacterium]|nr:purine nucleoside permease [Acidobacteriaceae bacterium]
MTFLLLMVFALLPSANAQDSQQKPWPVAQPWAVKIVILATFEPDSGTRPGEFRYWKEREHLTEAIALPGGVNPVYANADHSVIGLVTGMSLVNASASVMALGLDPQFDLTHAYWLMNGIAGVDPNVASLASAAWASYIIGDVGRYIDPHDAPKEWPYGFFASGAAGPGQAPAPRKYSGMGDGNVNLYALNPALVAFAYGLTKDLKLGDTDEMKAARALYTGFPNAQKPPFVLIGDTFSSDYFWHGPTSNKYAEDWVSLWTKGKGTFTMTAMEDSGVMQALQRLDTIHRVDFQRVMDLRVASNYSMPPPGESAVEGLTGGSGHFSGYLPSLESAYAAGNTVIQALLADWPKYEAKAPGE